MQIEKEWVKMSKKKESSEIWNLLSAMISSIITDQIKEELFPADMGYPWLKILVEIAILLILWKVFACFGPIVNKRKMQLKYHKKPVYNRTEIILNYNKAKACITNQGIVIDENNDIDVFNVRNIAEGINLLYNVFVINKLKSTIKASFRTNSNVDNIDRYISGYEYNRLLDVAYEKLKNIEHNSNNVLLKSDISELLKRIKELREITK
ncbi:MAG: hypothetical protein HFE51_09780 [Clostridia bacterium]|nr:hypothetical protein [Clostridia bacterium]NDO20293.1 hypothetical protein [Lachnospiraceae bacterium MD329]